MRIEAGDYTLHEVVIDVEKEEGGSFEGSLLFLTSSEDAEKTRDFIDGWYGKPTELIESLKELGIEMQVIGWESTDISFDGNNEFEAEEESGFKDQDYMFHSVIIEECDECDGDDEDD